MGMVMVYKYIKEQGMVDWAGDYHVLKPEGWYLVARLKEDHPSLIDTQALEKQLGPGLKLVRSRGQVMSESWAKEDSGSFRRGKLVPLTDEISATMMENIKATILKNHKRYTEMMGENAPEIKWSEGEDGDYKT